MAASYAFPWQLASAARAGGAYSMPSGGANAAAAALGGLQDWAGTASAAAAADAMRDSALATAAGRNTAQGIDAMGGVISTGLQNEAMLGAQGLETMGDLAEAEMLANARIREARMLRPDKGMQALRLAGGIGLGAAALLV